MEKIGEKSMAGAPGVLRIALMYVGTLLGAGFASGKEIWQFFGVFGGKGLIGVAFVTAVFMALGVVVVFIADKLKTNDMSRIIFPGSHRFIEGLISGVIMLFLFIGYGSMIAAGGSLAQQCFGVPHILGTGILMILVFLTAVKGFSRLSLCMGKVVPVLLLSTLVMAVYLLLRGREDMVFAQVGHPSVLAPSWFFAAVLFVSYNMMGAVVILGSCSLYAAERKKATKGALLGGAFLGGCALLLCLVNFLDPKLSAESPLPMLTFAAELAKPIYMYYAVVLLLAIFGTASSCFFGTVVKIPSEKKRVWVLLLIAFLGFLFSLMGFQKIVAVFYPLEGYLCLVFLLLMLCNFFRLAAKNAEKI